jgi:hypothetical protein
MMNNEFENTWKKTFVAYSSTLFRHLRERLRNSRENTVQICYRPSQDSNRVPPDYNSRELFLDQSGQYDCTYNSPDTVIEHFESIELCFRHRKGLQILVLNLRICELLGLSYD